MTTRKAAAVSMESELFERAKKRAKDLGFSTFSAYMTQLLRADLIARGELSIKEDQVPPSTPPRKEVTYETPPKKAKK